MVHLARLAIARLAGIVVGSKTPVSSSLSIRTGTHSTRETGVLGCLFRGWQIGDRPAKTAPPL